jgi:hypothetical protein
VVTCQEYFVSLISPELEIASSYRDTHHYCVVTDKVAWDGAQKCSTPGDWACVPYGGAGGDIDGLIMAGLNVVAIEREPHMIQAIKHRVTVIQARLSHDFDYEQWYEDLAQYAYSVGYVVGAQTQGGGGGGQLERTPSTYMRKTIGKPALPVCCIASVLSLPPHRLAGVLVLFIYLTDYDMIGFHCKK